MIGVGFSITRAGREIGWKCSSIFGSHREHDFVDGQCLRCHADWDGETP
jgi:hypothetical protein